METRPSSPQNFPSPPDKNVVLEGYMLKQASRLKQKYWHKRHFTLYADNTLQYSKEKGKGKLRASYNLGNQSGAEVSELFVDKNHKKLVYCVRISFAEMGARAGDTNTNDYSDEDSSDGDLGSVHSMDSPPQQPPPPPPPKSPTKSALRSPFNRKTNPRTFQNKGGVAAVAETPPPQHNSSRSADMENVPLGSRLRRRSMRRVVSNENNVQTELEHVPSHVEIEDFSASAPTLLGNENNSNLASPLVKSSCMRNGYRTSYETEQEAEQDFLRLEYLTARKRDKKKSHKKRVQGTKLAAAAGATVGVAIVTAGVGLVAGAIALGVAGAAGGSAEVANATFRRRSSELVIASTSYETAKRWKSLMDAALDRDNVEKSTWGQLFASDGRKARAALLPKMSDTVDVKQQQKVNLFTTNSKWAPLEGGFLSLVGSGFQGLRIFREEHRDDSIEGGDSRAYTQLSVHGKPCPPMKVHTVLSTSPLDAFLCLMSHGLVDSAQNTYTPTTEHRISFSVVACIDEHTDVIHVVFRPLFLFPSWTASRDFCVYRYWRLEQDGSYVVCYESFDHDGCPPYHEHVRGELHAVFNIAPVKRSKRRTAKQYQVNECLMTATVQVDPRGWIPTTPLPCLSNQAYGDAFTIAALLQLIDIRDAIDQDRFVAVAMENGMRGNAKSPMHHLQSFNAGEFPPNGLTRNASTDTADETLHEDFENYDFSYACNESSTNVSETAIGSRPKPLACTMWAEPDSNSFRVRGPEYKVDRQKMNAGRSIGRLVAVDVVSVDQPIYSGFTVHPTERIQLALKREKELQSKGLKSGMAPFIFVVNIVLPGPPFYHGVYYYAIDNKSTIDGSDGTPSSKLCNEFFFGESDEFRDRTFKLIPQIVQGNFIVRKAVGSTPAIMGKKLRQLYVKSDRFFEVVLDCGSSPVATGVIRLSLGYAKTLVVDMGFLLEGDSEEHLPERMFGCVRMKNLEFGPELRHVEAADTKS